MCCFMGTSLFFDPWVKVFWLMCLRHFITSPKSPGTMKLAGHNGNLLYCLNEWEA